MAIELLIHIPPSLSPLSGTPPFSIHYSLSLFIHLNFLQIFHNLHHPTVPVLSSCPSIFLSTSSTSPLPMLSPWKLQINQYFFFSRVRSTWTVLDLILTSVSSKFGLKWPVLIELAWLSLDYLGGFYHLIIHNPVKRVNRSNFPLYRMCDKLKNLRVVGI